MLPLKPTRQRASFKSLQTASGDDLATIRKAEIALYDELPARVLAHLKCLEFVPNGHPINPLEHSLQAATRAYRDKRDEEYVVCALLHDIGDIVCPHHHASYAALLLKPFVREPLQWMLEKHPIFQQFYFFETLGRDPNARDQFRNSPHFAMTAEFCERYDQCSFDPNYDWLSLEHFRPIMERVFKNNYPV